MLRLPDKLGRPRPLRRSHPSVHTERVGLPQPWKTSGGLLLLILDALFDKLFVLVNDPLVDQIVQAALGE